MTSIIATNVPPAPMPPSMSAAMAPPPQPPKAAQLLRPVYSLSTRTFRPREQYSAWRELISPLIDYRADPSGEPGFLASQVAWDLGGLALTHTVGPAANFSRTTRQIRADHVDHWFLSATRRGAVKMSDAARTSNSIPGRLVVQSLGHEIEGQTTEMDCLHLFIPRDFCRPAAAMLDAADNAELQSGLGLLLSDFVHDIYRRLPRLTADDLPGLRASVQAMVLACVAPDRERLHEANTPIQATLLERAKRLVLQRLYSPTFGADDICLELGVSRSRLYRMFEPLGGVVHYIRRRRLLDAHAALANPHDQRTIVEIAAERGFLDAAEFSRAFKREFGYRPTDARSNAGLWPAARRDPAAEDDANLSNLLMRLQ